MKIQTLALLVVAGSMVASGYLIGPAPGATVAASATVAATAAQASAAVPTATVRMMRPPVPLQLGTHDQYFTSPPADAAAIGAIDDKSLADKPLDDQAQAQSDILAKTAIEQDGYRHVRALVMGADGTWHGRAMRGSTEIAVSVDANGSVSAD